MQLPALTDATLQILGEFAIQHRPAELEAAPAERFWTVVRTTSEVEGSGGPGGACRVPANFVVGIRPGQTIEVEIEFPCGIELISIPVAALFPPESQVPEDREEPSLFGNAIHAWLAGLPAPHGARKDVASEIAWSRSMSIMAAEAGRDGSALAANDSVRLAAAADALAAAEQALGYLPS